MRLAVISDIHANADALAAVLARCRKTQVDRIVSAGDNIGYGPEPDAVVQALDTAGIPSVMGNHELALQEDTYLRSFNPKARKALDINRALLSERSIRKIAGYPPFMVRQGCRFVHGVPPDIIARYVNRESETRLAHIMASLKEEITFVGHTHELAVYSAAWSGIRKKNLFNTRVFLAKGDKYIVNTGSVGQSRYSYSGATYVVWDSEARIVESFCVPYDTARTVRLMKQAGIDERYGKMLISGHR